VGVEGKGVLLAQSKNGHIPPIQKSMGYFLTIPGPSQEFQRLKQAVSDRGVKATMKQVEAFILKQSAFQKTKTFKAPKEFNSIIAPRPISSQFLHVKNRSQVNLLGLQIDLTCKLT
jgi:hypothetical protein